MLVVACIIDRSYPPCRQSSDKARDVVFVGMCPCDLTDPMARLAIQRWIYIELALLVFDPPPLDTFDFLTKMMNT